MRRKAKKIAGTVGIIRNLIQDHVNTYGSCRVFAPGNGATIERLDSYLSEQSTRFPPRSVEYVQILPVGQPKWRSRGGIVPVTPFIGSANREAMNSGNGVFIADDLSRAVRSMAGKWGADIVIGHAAPARDGLYAMTLDGSLMLSGFMGAKGGYALRVLVVNPNMPQAYTGGIAHTWTDPVTGRETVLRAGCAVHEDEVDIIIEENLPLVDFPLKGELNPAWEAIARHIEAQGLIKDRQSSIQAGIGGPGALWRMLEGYRDLSVDTELASDSLVDAIEKGVVTGRNRSGAFHGKHVMGIIAGTKKIRDFVHRNPDVLILPQEWVNGRRERHPYSFSLNAAFGFSAFGEVYATMRKRVDGTVEKYSAIGGQRELIEEIRRTEFGVSVIGTPSIYRDDRGTIRSSITAAVPRGVSVSTPSELVDYLATEHGVVHIAHNDEAVVVERIISIAHPDFRDSLRKGVTELHPRLLPRLYPGHAIEYVA